MVLARSQWDLEKWKIYIKLFIIIIIIFRRFPYPTKNPQNKKSRNPGNRMPGMKIPRAKDPEPRGPQNYQIQGFMRKFRVYWENPVKIKKKATRDFWFRDIRDSKLRDPGVGEMTPWRRWIVLAQIINSHVSGLDIANAGRWSLRKPSSFNLTKNISDKWTIYKFHSNTKICSRFSDKVFHKIDFTANGLHKDHPLAWELIRK